MAFVHLRSFFVAALASAAACSLPAQCSLIWLSGDPIRFVRGDVRATLVWDPDGAGAAAPLLVVGGSFSVGTMLTTSLAAFDGKSSSALGTPIGAL